MASPGNIDSQVFRGPIFRFTRKSQAQYWTLVIHVNLPGGRIGPHDAPIPIPVVVAFTTEPPQDFPFSVGHKNISYFNADQWFVRVISRKFFTYTSGREFLLEKIFPVARQLCSSATGYWAEVPIWFRHRREQCPYTYVGCNRNRWREWDLYNVDIDHGSGESSLPIDQLLLAATEALGEYGIGVATPTALQHVRVGKKASLSFLYTPGLARYSVDFNVLFEEIDLKPAYKGLSRFETIAKCLQELLDDPRTRKAGHQRSVLNKAHQWFSMSAMDTTSDHGLQQEKGWLIWHGL